MKLALFDANGTLFNDIPVWYMGVKEIFNVFGGKPPTIAEYFHILKGDYLEVYRKCGVMASREEMDQIYESTYRTNMDKVSLSIGVKTLLRNLVQNNIVIGLITVQKDYLVIPLLYKFKIFSFFDYCEFSVFNKAEAIQKILRITEIDARACIFVADTPLDINNANKAGVKSVAFINGYIPEDLIAAANPKITIRRFGELRAVAKG